MRSWNPPPIWWGSINLPSLELTTEFSIGQKIWHRVSRDEGVIVGVSDYTGQWDVKWKQANQVIPTPEFMMRGWKPERLNAIYIEEWPEGIEGAV